MHGTIIISENEYKHYLDREDPAINYSENRQQSGQLNNGYGSPTATYDQHFEPEYNNIKAGTE